jgi:hypothetical protein
VARRIAIVAVVAAALGLTGAAPAQASHGCGSARSKGARIVVKSKEAVIFTKGIHYYGCLASVGTVRRLPEEGGGIDITPPGIPVLAGRYVAYSTSGSGIGDESDRIYVYDLRVGRRFLVVGSNFIRGVVLKRNGSVAWVEGSTVDPGDNQPTVYQIRKFSNEARQGVELVDRAADIDPNSLTLSADRTAIGWLRGGAPRSASLR